MVNKTIKKRQERQKQKRQKQKTKKQSRSKIKIIKGGVNTTEDMLTEIKRITNDVNKSYVNKTQTIYKTNITRTEDHLPFKHKFAFKGDVGVARNHNKKNKNSGVCSGTASNHAKNQNTFRIVTFNVHNWHAPCRYDLNQKTTRDYKFAIDSINTFITEPDLVAFTEFTLYPDPEKNKIKIIKDDNEIKSYTMTSYTMTNKNINEYIADKLGLTNYTLVDDFEKIELLNSFMGKALYSKSKILDSCAYVLNKESQDRTILLNVVNILGVNVLVGVVHLSYKNDDYLKAELTTIVEILKKFESLDLPQIILGDFNNDWKEKEAIFKILTNSGLELISSREKTAFNQDPNGVTIDQIYASQKLRALFKVDKTFVVKSTESDHYPIFVDLELKNTSNSKAPAPAPAQELFSDVLKRLITINAHGGKTSEKLTVPDWVYVMIPHHNGTSQAYTTPDASKDKLYEQSLYENGHFNYSHGWKLYKPNDEIDNINFTILSTDCDIIDKNHKLQQPLTNYCKKEDQSFEKYCTLYCTKQSTILGNNYEIIKYNNKNKIKIKACDSYKLSDVFNTLIKRLQRLNPDLKNNIEPNPDTISSENPILLIPFTCNDDGNTLESIKFADNCKEVDETPLHTYFMGLYQNKYKFKGPCKIPNFDGIQYTSPAPAPAPASAPEPPTEPETEPAPVVGTAETVLKSMFNPEGSPARAEAEKKLTKIQAPAPPPPPAAEEELTKIQARAIANERLQNDIKIMNTQIEKIREDSTKNSTQRKIEEKKLRQQMKNRITEYNKLYRN